MGRGVETQRPAIPFAEANRVGSHARCLCEKLRRPPVTQQWRARRQPEPQDALKRAADHQTSAVNEQEQGPLHASFHLPDMHNVGRDGHDNSSPAESKFGQVDLVAVWVWARDGDRGRMSRRIEAGILAGATLLFSAEARWTMTLSIPVSTTTWKSC